MVVEAAEAVEWTKPDELAYLDQPFFGQPGQKLGPLPKLGFAGEKGFHGLMCDGSVRFVKDTTDEKVIRALITPTGGEVVPLDSDDGARPPWDSSSKPPTATKEDWPFDAKAAPAGQSKGKTVK
jgi:hypothetical protein